MNDIREDFVWAAVNKAYTLLDLTINDLDKQYESRKKIALADKSLTKDEKSEIIKIIIEWIPYDDLQNVKYLTKGGCSEIYSAEWIDGGYYEWDSEENQLTRYGDQYVILKELENVKSTNESWFEESKAHLTINNKWSDVAQCHGLTKNPSSRNYMLVMDKMDMDLKTYLKQYYNNIILKDRIQIAYEIIDGFTAFIMKIKEVHKLLLKFQNYQDDSQKQIISDQHPTNINYNSKIYQFENLPEPKNATEEEQEAFHSKPYSLNIPNNDSNEKNVNIESSEHKEINSNYIIQDDHKKGIEQQTKKHSLDVNDDDEKQNELEITEFTPKSYKYGLNSKQKEHLLVTLGDERNAPGDYWRRKKCSWRQKERPGNSWRRKEHPLDER
ncbi:kinase-like domain-containing protein [Rhizophagus irregularis DAOM 181602=DAOM 197198]|nr:kinase-like domain-containing protein [Rhizophagus irregularis DAOM 181602=DAOM 197198]